MIARLVAKGRLHPIHRGVYAVGHTNLATRGHLAAGILAAGHLARRRAAEIDASYEAYDRHPLDEPMSGATWPCFAAPQALRDLTRSRAFRSRSSSPGSVG